MASNSSSSSLCFVSEDEEREDDDDGGNENRYATTRRRTAVLGAAAAAAAAVITMTPFTENAEAAVTSFVPKTATRAKTSLQNVVELTPENFKEYVSADAENPTPNVFVEFYAPWCPFCQKLEPIWNELPNELRKYGNETTIARMNVDKYTDYARAYGVSGFPTLMLFEAGKPVGAKTGLIDMQTALKYAGVSKAKLGFAAGPEKALDKVLTKDQVENARKELDIVRKEVSSGLAGESRDKALTALNVVDGVFVSQL
jgi:thiol-disulfide isomerase/thioredoxin